MGAGVSCAIRGCRWPTRGFLCRKHWAQVPQPAQERVRRALLEHDDAARLKKYKPEWTSEPHPEARYSLALLALRGVHYDAIASLDEQSANKWLLERSKTYEAATGR